MRRFAFFLSVAAVLFSAGVALAQDTATTPAPAPNEPVITDADGIRLIPFALTEVKAPRDAKGHISDPAKLWSAKDLEEFEFMSEGQPVIFAEAEVLVPAPGYEAFGGAKVLVSVLRTGCNGYCPVRVTVKRGRESRLLFNDWEWLGGGDEGLNARIAVDLAALDSGPNTKVLKLNKVTWR